MSLLSIARYFCKYMVYKSRRAALLLTKSRVFFWFGMVILALNLIFLMALHVPSPPLFISIVCKYTRRLAMRCCFFGHQFTSVHIATLYTTATAFCMYQVSLLLLQMPSITFSLPFTFWKPFSSCMARGCMLTSLPTPSFVNLW